MGALWHLVSNGGWDCLSCSPDLPRCQKRNCEAMHACSLGGVSMQQGGDGSAWRLWEALLAETFLTVLFFLVLGCESPPWQCRSCLCKTTRVALP